jgi:hypothetical protein
MSLPTPWEVAFTALVLTDPPWIMFSEKVWDDLSQDEQLRMVQVAADRDMKVLNDVGPYNEDL